MNFNRIVNFFDRLAGFEPWCTVHFNGVASEFATLEEARDYYRAILGGDHYNYVAIRDSRGNLLYERPAS